MAESSNTDTTASGLKNENILKTIGYFWSDALNCFMFGHGPMTPTLLDVAMITGLDIASPSPSAFKLPKVPFTLSSKKECTSWGAYLNRYMKNKGPVTEREHTAFLNFWLEHFIFCGPSLAPTKNYLSLAYELAKGTQLGLGKLFLGEIYRSLQLMSVKLFHRKTVKTGGPWWFIQLWAQLYFQNQIPDFPPLTTCTFPDVNGKEIRCTSYGQALYGLPGSRLIPKEAAGWFKIFFQGLDNPLFDPYTESANFENPVSFRLGDLADDAGTQHLYSIMIRPCFLPVGMSTSNRITKPGYECYQPVVAARQLGLGQVPPHFFLHHLTASRADLPDIITAQRCYTFFDALAIPIPHDLRFSFTTDGFETWWSMWKTHVFQKALGPLLRELDAEYDIPADQAEETSSGDVEEIQMPSATLDLATPAVAAAQMVNPSQSTEKPIVTASAVPPSLGEGYDLSSLLSFDPESIEPTSSKAGGEPIPSTVRGPLQRLKDLLSAPTETLIEDSEEAKGILEDIQLHLPMTLQVKLWPAVTLPVFKSRVQSARQRIALRHSQLPLRADIAERCRRLNEKKAALDAKTDTSATRAELETLRKELEDLEERVRVTKQLIQDKEAFVARSQDEAKSLTAGLKTDLAEIRTLSHQLVTGKDEDDKAEIAEADRVRVDAILALGVFLQ
ncbi:hypothetical protein QYE76_019291 [Lolium multiflorum]|uniref:Aminotransferase-like plant mobile domain-containing protein n=1 Tax=Lolium multiflorum TaxID=4521 RepID=A0AAD8VNZ0_LOLMU|nr:hypothetical protein QYE76_019291 [Lolium multiflorum]